MKKVKDSSGGAQHGLFSVSRGVFVYDNPSEYAAHMKRKEILLKNKEEVDSLRDKVTRLEKLIESLGKENNG